MQTQHPVLITADELRATPAEATVLDASWIYGPFNHACIDVRRRYDAAHIPGSWFLDLPSFSDPADRHDPRVEVITPPRPEALQVVMAHARSGPSSLVVVTDMDGGCATAPFARHALMHAGFANVRLLDGGTPAWRRGPVGLTEREPRYLSAQAGRRPSTPAGDLGVVFADYGLVKQAIREPSRAQIVDSRVDQGNRGFLPLDYVGLAVPATAYVSSSCALESADEALRFRSGPELRDILKGAGINPRGLKITTCYFGLGASVVATALEIAGFAPELLAWLPAES